MDGQVVGAIGVSGASSAQQDEEIAIAGFAVTTFQGEGMSGTVIELYIVCRRKHLREIVRIVHNIEPNAFYITEQVGEVSKIYRPIMTPITGWRAILKKK